MEGGPDWRRGLAHRPKPPPDVAAGVCYYGMRMVTTDPTWEARFSAEQRGPRLHRSAAKTDYWSKRRPFRQGAALRDRTVSVALKKAHENFPKIKSKPWKPTGEPRWAPAGIKETPPFSRVAFMDKVQRELDAGAYFGRPADGVASKRAEAVRRKPAPATLGYAMGKVGITKHTLKVGGNDTGANAGAAPLPSKLQAQLLTQFGDTG